VVRASIDAPDLDPYRQYLLGFQAGYSWQAPGPVEVFASLGNPPINKAPDAIAARCAGNARAKFAAGLKAVVRKMRSFAPAH
jgi:hypothetical protein